MREFDTGATRDSDEGKADYEGFLSPLVLEAYGAYMMKHQVQADGQLRSSDNWQRGIPKAAYMKSGYRHFFDWWKCHRGIPSKDGLVEALCALMFNTMGYLDVHLRQRILKGLPVLPAEAFVQEYPTTPEAAFEAPTDACEATCEPTGTPAPEAKVTPLLATSDECVRLCGAMFGTMNATKAKELGCDLIECGGGECKSLLRGRSSE